MRRCLVLVLVVAVSACTSTSTDTYTVDAVPMPTGMRTVTTVQDGSATVALLAADDCVRLLVRAGRRRSVGDDRCGITNPMTQDAEIHFNDRRRTGTKCPDDCGPPPPDLTLSGSVLYGHTEPDVRTLCLPGSRPPQLVHPDADGYFLVLVPRDPHTVLDTGRGTLLLWGADGRFLSPDPEQVPGDAIRACRDVVAPGTTLPNPSRWTVTVEVDPDPPTGTTIGIAVAPIFSKLGPGTPLDRADGATVPLELYPASETIQVRFDGVPDRPYPAPYGLPAEVRAALRGETTCAVRHLAVLVDDQLRVSLGSDC